MKKGFTMIELIFVIVILGILASVAIPRLAATRADAEITKTLANMRTFLSDVSAFYVARGDFKDTKDAGKNVAFETFTNVPFRYVPYKDKSKTVDGTTPQIVRFAPNIDQQMNQPQVIVPVGGTKDPCIGIQLAGSGGFVGEDNKQEGNNGDTGIPLIIRFTPISNTKYATDKLDGKTPGQSTTCKTLLNSKEIQDMINNKVEVIYKDGNGIEKTQGIDNAVLVGQASSVY